MKARKSPFKSDSNRIKHVNDYDIVQLEHYTLSETFYTEYGYKLTDQCYVVESIPKDKSDTTKQERVDIIGDYVAKKIFKLTNQQPIPLFNIYTNEYQSNGSQGASISSSSRKKYTPFNEQLRHATLLIMDAWKIKKPNNAFENIIKTIHKTPEIDVDYSLAKSLNTILDNKDKDMKDIIEIISKRREKNIKNFTFPKIKEVLQELGVLKIRF